MRKMLKLVFAASPLLVQGVCPGLSHGTPPTDKAPTPTEPEYDAALAQLDLTAVMKDLQELFTNSQECWPADFGNYGPFFIRLAWHCSGTYRDTDGKGGCGGGRQRFEPEASWPDNTNLDKARALLWPIKEKYGAGLSWGDLFTLAGSTAVKSMGGPVSKYCFGRIDDADGTNSLDLGPTPQQEKDFPCEVQGHCKRPLGSTTIGLIYLNPEGPVEKNAEGKWMPNPDPTKSAYDVRDAFGRMRFNSTQTVALIGGGHAFGKTHGACPKGAGPSPKDQPGNPWPGLCGSGKGADTFTSGFEGPWTTKPLQWDNEYFVELKNQKWEKLIGPGGHWQWRVQNPPTKELAGVMRLTSDFALLHDAEFAKIVEEYADSPAKLTADFDEAWFNLTTAGGRWSKNQRCISGSEFPHFEMPAPLTMRDDDVTKLVMV